MAYYDQPFEKIFWSKVTKTAFCWRWDGATTKGYGTLYIPRRFKLKDHGLAHRVSYELTVGKIPDGLQLDHLCKNKSCVNPDHLEAVTAKVNTLRSSNNAAINAKKQYCDNGHAFDNNPPRWYAERGWRRCRTCHNERERVRQARMKLGVA